MNRSDLLVRIDSQFEDKGFKSAEASAKALVREMDRQEAEVRRMGNLQMQAHREDQRRQAERLTSIQSVGRGMTAVGVLAAAGMGIAAKSAMDWETAWAGVTKTVDGTAEQMAALEGELRDMAKNLPATHEEIAAVAEAAGQLGVRRQDIAGFTRTMIDLGVSTNLSADEAATAIAQITNVMGTMKREGTEGVSRFSSTLVALGNAGASTEKDIVEMAARLAGAGKIAGLSEANVLALANTMSSLGIEAQLGGSAMSRVLLTINSAAIEGGDSIYKFAQVAGTSADEFSAKWKANPAQAVDMLIKGLARIDAQGGDVATTLRDLGLRGTENASVMLRLSGAGDLLTESLELGNKAWEENSALAAEAGKRYETAESRIKMARNQLNDAAIDIGGTVLPAIAGASERVGFLAEAFQKLPGPVKESVSVLGGIVGVAGTVGGGLLMLIPKLQEMNATLANTGPRGAAAARGLGRLGGALMGPWGIALVAATTALGIFAEKQFEAQQRVDDLTKTLDEQTGAYTALTREKIVANLSEEGVLKSAESLGIALEDVTNAILGQADARDRLNRQLAAADQFTSTDPEAVEQTGTAIQKVRDAIGGQSSDLEKSAEKWRLEKEARGAATEAGVDATSTTETLTGAITDQGDAADTAAQEIDDLVKAILGYGDTMNDALDATSGYEAALDDASAAFEKNGKTANKARNAMNLHTEAGRANDKALRNIATSALEMATANFKNGDSLEKVTGQVGDARDEFVKMARKMNLSEEAANELADRLGLTEGNVQTLAGAIEDVPTSHATNMIVKTAQAKADLARLQSRINSLRGNDVTITTRYVTIGTRPTGGRSTAGGIVKDFDVGGYTGDIPVDQVAGRVHGQEFVLKPGPTRRYRAEWEAINAGQDPAVVFATSARSTPISSNPPYAGGSGLDVDALASALAQHPIFLQAALTIDGRQAGSLVAAGTRANRR